MYMHNEEHHKLFQVTPNKSICTLVVSSSGKAQLKQSRSGVARHQCDTDAPAVLYMTVHVRRLPFFQFSQDWSLVKNCQEGDPGHKNNWTTFFFFFLM